MVPAASRLVTIVESVAYRRQAGGGVQAARDGHGSHPFENVMAARVRVGCERGT
jgi:hypothetical protein